MKPRLFAREMSDPRACHRRVARFAAQMKSLSWGVHPRSTTFSWEPIQVTGSIHSQKQPELHKLGRYQLLGTHCKPLQTLAGVCA